MAIFSNIFKSVFSSPFKSPFGSAGRPPAFTDIPAVESYALEDFYTSTNGPNWTNQWAMPGDPGYDGLAANLYGVTVTGGRVTKLSLFGDPNLVGDGLGFLAPLGNLTYLRLNSTGIASDVGFLAPLVNLTYVNLGETGVYGEISGLAPLVNLSAVYLYDTGVYGDISGLAPLENLTYVNIYNTAVNGDIGSLAPLVSLAYLYAYGTGVSGSVGGLAPLVDLIHIYLYNTAVNGDIGGLAPLVNLSDLRLYNTGVTGNSSSDISAMSGITTLLVHTAKVTTDGLEAIMASLYAGRATRPVTTINIAGQKHPDTGAAQPVNAATEAMIQELIAEPYNWTITRTV